LQDALGRFLDRGGAIVFYGATMRDREIMGEHGGVVDWYEYRPKISYQPIGEWKFRASPDGGDVEHAQEYGLKQGWHAVNQSDSGWTALKVPQVWKDHPSAQYTGWEWFKTHLYLPAEAKGQPLVLTLGRVNSRDWTYLNGVLAGSDRGARAFRSYWITTRRRRVCRPELWRRQRHRDTGDICRSRRRPVCRCANDRI